MPVSINNLYQYIFENKTTDLAKIPDKKRDEAMRKRRQQVLADLSDLKDKMHFRTLLREQQKTELEDALYGDHTTLLEAAQPWPAAKEIRDKFFVLDEQYKFFRDNAQAETTFKIVFHACKLIADFSEDNNTPADELAYLNAYKCMVLLGWNSVAPLKITAEFIKQHGAKFAKPLHDLLVNNIPVNSPPLQLKEWQKLIRKSGTHALKLFQQAPEIEIILNKRAPRTMLEAREAASRLTYKRIDKNPELAALCLQHNISEAVFDQCLTIKPKTSDALPDVIIDGKSVDFPGYFLLKLPFDDPRAYILGHLTNCCQSIGGDSERCVIEGVTLPKTGFYVLLKAKELSTEEKTDSAQPLINKKINYHHYKLVGQGLLWESWTGNLTFDSWENLTPDADNKIAIRMLTEFSKQVTGNGNIMRVTIGLGGKTPKEFRATMVRDTEIIDEGFQYYDSLTQGLIYINQEKSASLQKILMDKHGLNVPLTSIRQAEFIETLFSESNKKLYQHSLTEDNLTKYMQDSSDNIFLLAIYYYFHQGNMLTNANIDKLRAYQQSKYYEPRSLVSIASSLRSLASMMTGLSTQQFIPFLFRQEVIIRMQMQAINIYRISKAPIHPEILTFIFSMGKSAIDAVKIIAPLAKINIKLVLKNLKLIHENNYVLSGMTQIISYLADISPQLITDKTFKAIISNVGFFNAQNTGHFAEIRDIFNTVTRHNLEAVDQQLFDLIAASSHQNDYENYIYQYQKQVVAILDIFSAANPDLIDKVHLKKIFLIDGAELIHVRHALDTLFNIDSTLITREHVDLLFKHPKFAMTTALSLEVLEDYHLVNTQNLHLLLTKMQSAPLVAQILIDISLNHIPLDEKLYSVLENEKELNHPHVTKRLAEKLNKLGIFLNKSLAEKTALDVKQDSPRQP